MIIPLLATLLEALGAVMGLVGALLMANQYLKILRGLDVAAVLVSALWRGSLARGTVQAGELSRDDKLHFLQGLGFVFTGFTFQLAGYALILISILL